jgi:NADH-quinone oxidoreductase subunit N
MMVFEFPNLVPVFPELMLAVVTLLLLVVGAVLKKDASKLVTRLGVFALLALGVFIFRQPHEPITTFSGMFVNDGFAAFMKILVIAGSAISMLMATSYLQREKINSAEYPILILFSTLGMMLMISANDLISLYMALELQSLPLYVLAAIRRDSSTSTEAGLKYFVLGALSSGMLLYGASLIYGFTGSTGFATIAASLLENKEVASLGVITGIVLMLSGLAFKISAVPFHMWAPDVYEGAPTPVTAFFAIAPKVAAIALITRVLLGPFGSMVHDWRQIVEVIAVASMVLGAVAAISQTNIKRLLAYSSIGHMGYALVGLVAANVAGVQGVLIYLTLYMVMSIGVFCIVLMMKRHDKMIENIHDLAGLAKSQPMLALAMAVMMFSMAGIPPLAGFFGKLFIFQSAVSAGFYTLAIIGVVASVVSTFYYLRVIKLMYFDEAPMVPMDAAKDVVLNSILAAATLLTVGFIFVPAPLLGGALGAAETFAPTAAPIAAETITPALIK